MLRFDERVWLLWAVWILLLPLKWLVAVVVSACVHEVFHISAVLLTGGTVRCVRVMPLCTVIEVERIGCCQEIICALAGPAGSFLLLAVVHYFPLLGLCGLIQGVFNLLPVYPMDGGRALRCILECAFPHRAVYMFDWIERITLFLIFLLSLLISVYYSLGSWPVLLCILAIMNALLRKRP